MSPSTHPLYIMAALGSVASVIMLGTVFQVRSKGLKALLLLIAVLTLAPLGLVVVAMYPEWLDARIRSYKGFYDGIQLGMTRDEVMAVQAQLYPAGGPRRKPRIIMDEPDSLTFFMDPEDPSSAVDCEAILLDLKAGKVVTKKYSPD